MQQVRFDLVIDQICEEKNIPREVVIETIEAALAAAYKKDYGEKTQEVKVVFDETVGEMEIFVIKEVAKEVEDPYLQISLEEAKKINKGAKAGDTIDLKQIAPQGFGRIAAQTAKQVISQRLREAEKEVVFSEYKDKEEQLVVGVVQRIEGNNVFVDLDKTVALLPSQEQIPGEHYYIGQRLKFMVLKVEQTPKGPQVFLSRSDAGVIRALFESEVPEIRALTVEIKAIAREAGARTKVAVWSNQENLDPVGSCVGQRGVRIQTILSELGEEKIDIILWDSDPKKFIMNALSPAKVIDIDLIEKLQKAIVKVPDDQLSLAIGKQGQNVRLAAKLTGWNIDVVGESGKKDKKEKEEDEFKDKENIEEKIIEAVEKKDQGEPQKKAAVNKEEIAEEAPQKEAVEEMPLEKEKAKAKIEASEESSKEGTAKDSQEEKAAKKTPAENEAKAEKSEESFKEETVTEAASQEEKTKEKISEENQTSEISEKTLGAEEVKEEKKQSQI